MQLDAAVYSSTITAIQCLSSSLLTRGDQTVSMIVSRKTKSGACIRFVFWVSCLLENEIRELILVDIKVKEQSIENMARGRKIYEPPRYMSVNTAVEQLLEIEETGKEGSKFFLITSSLILEVCTPNTVVVGLARVGSDTQKIVAGTLEELVDVDFGAPLHSLVIPGKMHFLEAELLKTYAVNADTFSKYADVSDH